MSLLGKKSKETKPKQHDVVILPNAYNPILACAVCCASEKSGRELLQHVRFDKTSDGFAIVGTNGKLLAVSYESFTNSMDSTSKFKDFLVHAKHLKKLKPSPTSFMTVDYTTKELIFGNGTKVPIVVGDENFAVGDLICDVRLNWQMIIPTFTVKMTSFPHNIGTDVLATVLKVADIFDMRFTKFYYHGLHNAILSMRHQNFLLLFLPVSVDADFESIETEHTKIALPEVDKYKRRIDFNSMFDNFAFINWIDTKKYMGEDFRVMAHTLYLNEGFRKVIATSYWFTTGIKYKVVDRDLILSWKNYVPTSAPDHIRSTLLREEDGRTYTTRKLKIDTITGKIKFWLDGIRVKGAECDRELSDALHAPTLHKHWVTKSGEAKNLRFLKRLKNGNYKFIKHTPFTKEDLDGKGFRPSCYSFREISPDA
jgi:hypothetical protein